MRLYVFCVGVFFPDDSSRCLYLYFKIQLRDYFCGSDLAEIFVPADI